METSSRNGMRKRSRYLKSIVVFCIAFISLFTIVETYLNYKIGIEINPTLTTCVYGFFGTELCVSSIIKIVENCRTSRNINKEGD